MTALIVDRQPSVKDRLIGLLNALEYGLYPPDCGDCKEALADRCGAHSQDIADMGAVGRAVGLVQTADGDDEARRAFLSVMASLSGSASYGVASGVMAGGAR